MKISRITAIEPDGKAWTPRNSTTPLYPFLVSFADGMKGQANSKSEPPPYAVGDDVGYEQTGTSPRGVPKLKIDRKAAAEGGGDDGGGQRSAPRGTATTARQPAASGSSINGQTVGMAMKEALTLTNMTTLKPDDPEFWKQVHITASDIIRVSLMLEKGKLAPSAKDRADPDGAAKRAAVSAFVQSMHLFKWPSFICGCT